jgi:hypothetical protein
MSSETPSLGELLRETASMVIGRLSICLPAVVRSYDAARQVALVQPAPSSRRQIPGDVGLEVVPLPQIADVPVLWPSWAGGAAAICGTLQPGDHVVLIIADRSIDEWKAAVSAPYTPRDIRRCSLTDAFAFPGGRPPAAALPAAARPLSSDPPETLVLAGSVKVGSSAAVDPVVTESRLISALSSLVTTFNAHTHGGVLTGSGVTLVPTPLQTTPAAGSLSSSALKAT